MNSNRPNLHLVRGPPLPHAMLRFGAQRNSSTVNQDGGSLPVPPPGREALNDDAASSAGLTLLPRDSPTQDELAVMAAHGILFDGCGFRFAGYRHGRLVDAVRESRQSGKGCE